MKEKIAFAFTVAVGLLTVFQGLISSMTFLTPEAVTITSAITYYLVTTLTVWKQKLSEEIQTKAIWSTIIVAMIATIGGLGDLIHVFHISDMAAQVTRFIITFVTMSLNFISKVAWPTPQTKSIL